jgi:hypothetical protein
LSANHLQCRHTPNIELVAIPQRRLSAKSGLVQMKEPNDWTDVTLPDAGDNDRSPRDPILLAEDLDRGGSLIPKKLI